MAAAHNLNETMPLPARLIDSALALARAELAVVLVHTRELAVRAVTALLATIVAAAFAQTALLLLVLTPFLAQAVAIEALVVAIVLSLGLAFVAATAALLTWRSVHRSVSSREVSATAENRVPDGSSAAESSRSTPPTGAPPPTEANQHPRTTSVTLAERMS